MTGNNDNVMNFIRDRFNHMERTMSDGFADIKKDRDKQDERIGSLEESRTKALTIVWVISAISGSIASCLVWLTTTIFKAGQ